MIQQAVDRLINGVRYFAETSEGVHGITGSASSSGCSNNIAELLAVDDAAEPTGRFRLLLSLARFTGRRINALCSLRAFDKCGYEAVVPLFRDVRTAIDVYLRHHPMAGEVPLRPSTTQPHLSCGKIVAGRWLRCAETLAKLPKLARGAWHLVRPQFASERRHLPDADIMAAAG
jgi:hypothetical protein